MLEFLAAAKFQDALTLLVCAFFLAAPLVVPGQLAEDHGLLAVVTLDLQNLNELLEDMR